MSNNKKCVISVGNSQELSGIVQKFLFDKGFGWTSTNDRKVWSAPVINYGDQNACIFANDGCLEYSPKDHFIKNLPHVKIFNAATQMGEIIKFFEKLVRPLNKIIGVEGEELIFYSNGDIKYKCTYLTKNNVDRIFEERKKFAEELEDFDKCNSSL